MFASKSPTEKEQRCANIEWEILAVIFESEKFGTYIYGHPFIIESDHKPLEIISLKSCCNVSLPSMNAAMPTRVQHGHYISTSEGHHSRRWTITATRQESRGSYRFKHKGRLCTILNRKIDTDTPGYKR